MFAVFEDPARRRTGAHCQAEGQTEAKGQTFRVAHSVEFWHLNPTYFCLQDIGAKNVGD